MSHHEIDFLIQSERRRGEMAYARQRRELKAAQRGGLVLLPLLDLKQINRAAITAALARSLARLGDLLNRWSVLLSPRHEPTIDTNPAESQS